MGETEREDEGGIGKVGKVSTTIATASLAEFTPEELGLPSRYTEFRPAQVEAVDMVVEAIDRGVRFVGLGLPTGSGKTLVARTLQKYTGMRAVVLTSTKGLQQQYCQEFADAANVMGKDNYLCLDPVVNPSNYLSHVNVSCRFGAMEGCGNCDAAGPTTSCNYGRVRDIASRAPFVVTNYAYWIKSGRKALVDKGVERNDPIELLILDEGHKAMEELGRSMQVQLKEKWVVEAELDVDGLEECKDSVGDLGGWAEDNKLMALEWLKEQRKQYKLRKSEAARNRVYVGEELADALDKMSMMGGDDWVCEVKHPVNRSRAAASSRVWELDAVWPGASAEGRLFMGVKAVVVMSATLKPLAMKMLGVPGGPESMAYKEWPRVFPANHTPVYHVPTVRMNHKVDETGLRKWVDRIDEIIESRRGRKGIVHTVSYVRQQYLLAHSRHAGIMMVNGSGAESEGAAVVVERFKKANPPAVLVSPSFSTGWDFPGSQCEWMVIAKLPYPDGRSKVMAARKERQPQYLDYLCMQDLVQACGRGSRSMADRCECFVVDDSIEWFMYRHKGLAPGWFQVSKVPKLPELGKRGGLVA